MLNLGPYSKFVAAVVGQFLTYASLYWGSGPDAKYVTIAVAVASALGVYAVPNAGKPTATAPAAAAVPQWIDPAPVPVTPADDTQVLA